MRYTTAALRETALCERKMASRIADAYMLSVPVRDRIVAFHVGTTTDELFKAEKANAQLIARFMNGTVKLPADLEEAWVRALPEPYHGECARELARRYGFLAARQPTKRTGGATSLAELAREFGETIEALVPVLSDGKIDATDRPFLKRALKESTDLMAALVSLQAQLHAALPDGADPPGAGAGE